MSKLQIKELEGRADEHTCYLNVLYTNGREVSIPLPSHLTENEWSLIVHMQEDLTIAIEALEKIAELPEVRADECSLIATEALNKIRGE